MSFMRGIGRWLLTILMGLTLGTWLVVATLQMTILNRQVVKGWVQSSGLYDKAIDTIPFEVNGDSNTQQSFITSADIKAALKTTFPASYLQTHVETILDSTYNWLEHKTEKITFTIPVNEKVTDFATHLAEQLQPKLAALPACQGLVSPSSNQPTCIPKGLNIAQYAAQLSDITNEGGDNFLSKPITQDSLGNTGAHLGWLPSVVSQMGWLALALPAFGVLCGAGYVFLSNSKLHGLKVVGRRVFFQGLVACILGGLVWYFGQQISLDSVLPTMSEDGSNAIEKSIVQNLVEPLLRNVLPSFGQVITLLSAVLAVVGGAVWLTAIMVKKHGEGQKQHFEHIEHSPNPLLHPEPEAKTEELKDLPKSESPQQPPKPPRPLVM